MKISLSTAFKSRKGQLAATLAEVTTSVGIIGFMFMSLYGGMSSGFAFTRLARESLRGTQILLERVEGIRLYNWNQLVYSNMIPTGFTNYYYPLATNNASKGIAYIGTMSITTPTLSPSATYNDNIRQVSVSINWTNGNVRRVRTMSTYVSKNGVQNYVFSD